MQLIYVDVVAFAIIAALVPLLMLLISALMRHSSESNSIKNANYESAEANIGTERSIIEEYFHYFSLFLGFEIVGIIMLLWAAAAKEISFISSIYIFLIAIVAMIFIFLGIVLARRREYG